MSAHLYATLSFPLYVHHTAAPKKLLREAYVMEAVELPPRSVFVSHGLVQHASSEWRGEHYNSHHSYLTPGIHDLSDATACAHGGSTALVAETHSLPVEKGLDHQMGDSDDQSRTMHGFCKSSGSQSSDSKLFLFVLQTRNIPEEELNLI